MTEVITVVGMNYGEISQITGKSEASCKMMYSRAITNLRKDIPLALLIIMQIVKNNIL